MRKLKRGSIQQRGDSWRISYYDVNAIRQFETWPSREDAERELTKRLAEIQQGIAVTSKASTVQFGALILDVLDDYEVNGQRSRGDAEARFKLHIGPVFGKRKASQITTAQINAYILKRRDEGARPATINRELALIRRTFNLALEGRKVASKPHVPMLRESNTRTGFFTREEVERLCAQLKPPYSGFVRFAFLTGWRKDEIRNLQWRNVDFQAGEIRLDPGTTKNGEARVFPMTRELRSLLEAVRATAEAEHRDRVKQERVRGCPVAAITPFVFAVSNAQMGEFRKTWARACMKAGLPCVIQADGSIRAGRLIHDLRRSAAREMENAGVPRSVIKELMGHKTDSMFSRYRIVSADDKRRAAEIIDGATDGAKSGTIRG